MKIQVWAETEANQALNYQKPSEDRIWIDTSLGLFLVADGVSRELQAGAYPQPSPAAEATQYLGNELLRWVPRYLESLNPIWALRAACLKANELLGLYQARLSFEPAYFYPGAVFILGFLRDQTFYYAYLGDVSGRLLRGGHICLFTNAQTHRLRRHETQLSRKQIRTQLCNQASHPLGYGVANGQIGMRNFLSMGAFPMRLGDRIVLASDGVDPWWKVSLPMSERIALLSQPLQIFKQLSALETRWNLRSDDKSIIIIELQSFS